MQTSTLRQHQPEPGDMPPEKWFRLFGLVVVRKTDLLAGAAFFIAVSTTLYQLWIFATGAAVQMFHPDTVYIFFDKSAAGVRSTRIAGQTTFTNSGAVGRNAVVRSVDVSVKVADTVFSEHWLSFASVFRDEIELNVVPKESAHPFVVPGGSAASEMIAFTPGVSDCSPDAPKQGKSVASLTLSSCVRDTNYVSDDAFLGAALVADEVELTFVATVFDSKKESRSRCIIFLSPLLKRVLPLNDWVAASCESRAIP